MLLSLVCESSIIIKVKVDLEVKFNIIFSSRLAFYTKEAHPAEELFRYPSLLDLVLTELTPGCPLSHPRHY